jgi:ankyrin repeat protein
MSEQQMSESLQMTLSNWANSVTLSDDGWTALHLACKNTELFLYLVNELKANVSLKNKNGVSVMHKAAMDDNSYLITYLRDKHGFDISETDVDGNTPLHFACFNSSEYAAFWLIGFGAEINA